MLKRKIYNDLKEWKNNKKNECLLVKGPRQVGKTYIIEQFGKTEYASYIYINFIESPQLKNIFDGAIDAKTIYQGISLNIPGVKFIEHETLIFIDEIQECPNARTALKFLAIDGLYDVIASGSLLGIKYKDISSIPVGYERQIQMYGLDFEEFLWALDINAEAVASLADSINLLQPINEQTNSKMLSYFRQYAVIGGMPEVVNSFIESNNYQLAYKTQQKILDSYRDDIEKYAPMSMKQKIYDCYMSIPRQLSQDHTKFKYSNVKEKGRADYYANSINWLVDAGLVAKVCNVTVPEIPLIVYEKSDDFKLYATDIGLTTSMYGFETQKLLVTDQLKGTAKGGIYENLIFDQLNKRGIKLFYFKNTDSTQEIEFIMEKDGFVVPIEVKAKNGATLSLNTFIKKYKPKYAYKLINGNVGQEDTGKRILPQYMSMFI